VILLSLSAAAAGSLLASRSWSPLMLIMAVSLAYVNTSLYHPAAYSFTTSIFDPRDRPKALGIHGAGGTLGIAIGPLSVGLLMGLLSLDWREIYLFWFFPLLIGIILLIPLKGEIEIEEEEVRIEEGRTIFTLSLLLFLSFLAMRMMGSQMVAAFLTLYLVDVRGLSQTWASLIYGFNPLVGLIAAPIGGFLAARFGEKRWLLCVLAISYTSLGLALISPHILPFALLYIAYGFFNYLGMAANSAIMARLSPRGRRGLGFGLYFLPIYIVGAIAPLLAAKLASLYGLQMIFPLALTLLALCLLILKLGVKM
jgi:MFS family permease